MKKIPKIKESSFKKWEDYFQKYEKWLKEVREETFKIFPRKSEAVVLPISDSIEFYPRGEVEWDQTPHSFSGILRNSLWKLTNWISLEILNGKYFEAMRDIRFLFEGSILGTIMEDAIEEKIFEKHKTLSDISLKQEIIRLQKILQNRGVYKIRNQKTRLKKVAKFVEYFFRRAPQEMRERKKKEYIKDYFSILTDKRVGCFIPKLIGELKKEEFLSINSNQEKKLKSTWKDLCEYSHFPGVFVEEMIEDPHFIFLEKSNRRLFKKCVDSYLRTLDLFYAVVLWRWPIVDTKNRIKNLVNFWKKEFNINFPLTKKMFKNEA